MKYEKGIKIKLKEETLGSEIKKSISQRSKKAVAKDELDRTRKYYDYAMETAKENPDFVPVAAKAKKEYEAAKIEYDKYEKGGTINSRRFTENDFRRLTQDSFSADLEGNHWIIYDGSLNPVGKFYYETEKISFIGKKDLSNPLVEWLQQNSFVSNDEYFKLKKGGIIDFGFLTQKVSFTDLFKS